MATSPEFPHLQLAWRGQFKPKFNGGSRKNAEVAEIKADPKSHAQQIRGLLDRWVVDFEEVRILREKVGLPAVPADRGFVLRVPPGSDGDAIAHALGLELVAETDTGLMFVATGDLSLRKLRSVLDKFELGMTGGGSGASVLEVFDGPEDPRRLAEILTEEVHAMWPFDDVRVYVFDLGIQIAESTHKLKWPSCPRRKGETVEAHQVRRESTRRKATVAWVEAWDAKVDSRMGELKPFVDHAEYRAAILAGPMNEPERELKDGLVFADCFQVRLRMTGAGFKDVLRNFPHLFEIALPDVVEQPGGGAVTRESDGGFSLQAPAADAPAVCVIDSGIQENHRWLAAAIDGGESRNFIPNDDPADTADRVSPRGHGTRVAGAVLYPGEIPRSGQVEAIAWIQNARVLTAENELPSSLPPERYLAAVVRHFRDGRRDTKIFNHSINSRIPCPKRRMSAWAAKLDELSHEHDVLFLQSAGNLALDGGNQANPGLRSHLKDRLQHPDQLLVDSSRVANPAQSLHALTVGAVAQEVFDDASSRTFASEADQPSGFSRAGFAPPWQVVKPEVVEIGGDVVHEKSTPHLVRLDRRSSVELLASTLHGGSAIAKDDVGTSYATPKVAHIAAHLQQMLPEASPLLYRALIVQSARWPAWAEAEPDKDRVLRLIGYGLPSLERATNNAPNRVTLITLDRRELRGKRCDIYTVTIPEELRGAALEARIRVDVTLAYTAEPRRTRARHRSYLETWLDWESSNLGEPFGIFRDRMEKGGGAKHTEFPWMMRQRDNWGTVEETNRTRGTVQKDWAVFDAADFPEEFAIAVRGHIGWNHREDAGEAKYCLVVSFEVLAGELPIYQLIEQEIRPEVKIGQSG
ncbi:MAG: S8 family peptidase [Opitutaceae bacterium]|nr:S8 family peptidase [Opitutaceae bacterium]